ncbi:hypothetical protein T02_8463 [Trichinella nativa]|uniref:Uncharacterized protein n=1 Tax=Trichinella nativa TaxID=6335 RepID=A0A0V1KJI0_9BILA|nr:hypothetical protein T02_8463 [Trichinella nativa]
MKSGAFQTDGAKIRQNSAPGIPSSPIELKRQQFLNTADSRDRNSCNPCQAFISPSSRITNTISGTYHTDNAGIRQIPPKGILASLLKLLKAAQFAQSVLCTCIRRNLAPGIPASLVKP